MRVNSYALAKQSNAAIIYGTKMGIELAYMGIPTIVAGELWARNKGFTLDASSREDYLALLDRLPLSHELDEAVLERAAKYAFHFFFRRTIPLEFLTVQKGVWPPFRVRWKTWNRCCEDALGASMSFATVSSRERRSSIPQRKYCPTPTCRTPLAKRARATPCLRTDRCTCSMHEITAPPK